MSAGGKALDAAGLLAAFPKVAFAFTYGSGVFRQASYSAADQPMIDCVFAVDDPVSWHRENYEINPAHYSFLAAAGPRLCAAIQTGFGSRMYYNTQVPLPLAARGAAGQLMKYGVVATSDLVDDLRTWRFLYAAGRMHKPVNVIESRADVAAAATANHRAAAAAALLSLPARFSAWDLYVRIAGLSYAGDFRMAFGEHPDKVANIVTGSAAHFHALYRPLLLDCGGGGLRQVSSPPLGDALSGLAVESGPAAAAAVAVLRATTWEQDTSIAARLAAAHTLPLHVQLIGGGESDPPATLTPNSATGSSVDGCRVTWARAVDHEASAASARHGQGGDVGPALYEKLVGPTLTRIVASSARSQSLKGACDVFHGILRVWNKSHLAMQDCSLLALRSHFHIRQRSFKSTSGRCCVGSLSSNTTKCSTSSQRSLTWTSRS